MIEQAETAKKSNGQKQKTKLSADQRVILFWDCLFPLICSLTGVFLLFGGNKWKRFDRIEVRRPAWGAVVSGLISVLSYFFAIAQEKKHDVASEHSTLTRYPADTVATGQDRGVATHLQDEQQQEEERQKRLTQRWLVKLINFYSNMFGATPFAIAALERAYNVPPLPAGPFKLPQRIRSFYNTSLLLGGGYLSLRCCYVFLKLGLGTTYPEDPPRRFVASGPYTVIRNPMVVGSVAAGIGGISLLRSRLLAVFIILLSLWHHQYLIKQEEPELVERFSDDYREYKTHVQRWLPGVPWF